MMVKKTEIIEESLIVEVTALDDVIEVLFDTGRKYALRRAFLADNCGLKKDTNVVAAKSEMGGTELHIVTSDGKSIVIPWDFILYHFEPQYEYYKRSSKKTNRRTKTNP